MSLTHTRYGGRVVLQARGRIRDDEVLRKRDRVMYAEHWDGMSVDAVAKMFRIDRSVVYKRFKAIPFALKKRLEKDASFRHRVRIEYLGAELEALESA